MQQAERQAPLSIAPALEEGVVIANRFKLLRPLSKGGMGSVWVAYHTTLGIEVAVKFVDVAGAQKQEAFRRFEREANVIARMRSPHVVQILDYGLDEAQRPYLAMELLNGESLRNRLDRAGRLTIDETVRIVSQVCHALSKAHKAGIIHRDIKPANIFLCEDEDSGGFLTKVLDFGIAKMVNKNYAADAPGEHTETVAGALVGTPLYMSPEQALGSAEIDARSDLYSLGIVAWCCLVGRTPFETNGQRLALGELLVTIATKPVPPPSSAASGIPPEVDAWFAKVLAKTPDDRYPTAKLMADGLAFATNRSGMQLSAAHPSLSSLDDGDGVGDVLLESFDGKNPEATGPRPAARSVARLEESIAGASKSLKSPPFEVETATPPKRKPMLALVAVGFALLVALGVGVALKRGSEPTAAATPPPAARPAAPAAPESPSATAPVTASASTEAPASVQARDATPPPTAARPTPHAAPYRAPRRPEPVVHAPAPPAPAPTASTAPTAPAATATTRPRGSTLDERL